MHCKHLFVRPFVVSFVSAALQYSGVKIVYIKPRIFHFAAAMFCFAVCCNIVYVGSEQKAERISLCCHFIHHGGVQPESFCYFGHRTFTFKFYFFRILSYSLLSLIKCTLMPYYICSVNKEFD